MGHYVKRTQFQNVQSDTVLITDYDGVQFYVLGHSVTWFSAIVFIFVT